MPNEDGSGSRFIVDLGDIKLPDVVEKQVEAEIQASVLRALAESDYGRRQPPRIEPISIWDQFPGQTLGLWLGDRNKPPIFFGSGRREPLSPKDHTLIMRKIMEHPLEVIRYLPHEYKSKTGQRPSGEEVLQAALKVNQIDDYVKDRIRAVLDVLPKIEEAHATLPEPVRRTVDGLRQQLANKTFEEKRSVLREAGLRSGHREKGLAEGFEVAAQILEDGRDSIYSPDHSLYKLLQEGQASSSSAPRYGLGGISDLDQIGAVTGGFLGSGLAGIGAGPGAVAGGAGASAAAAVSDAIDWLSDLFD